MDRSVESPRASARFRVSVSGKDVFVSDVLRPSSNARKIEVPLDGAQTFDLIVDPGEGRGESFSADWADACVVLHDGSRLWMDDLAKQWRVGTELPFSFLLGGRPSQEFLSSWKREVQEKEIDAATRRRIVTLTDPKTGLELRAEAMIYLDAPGVDWTLHLTNRGSQETPVIEQLRALDVTVTLGAGATPVLHRLRGSSCAVNDWEPFHETLEPGQRIAFAPREGKSSLGACPFFNLEDGGGGVITAIGWSGQWVASVERTKSGGLRLQAGIENLHLKLRPGEAIRSPRILQLYWFGDEPFRGYNLFRRTMFHHVTPKLDGKTVAPPIVHLSTSFYELNDSAESNVLSHLESIKGLGFEMFWLDAYWTRGGFPEGMGNYGFPIQRVEPPDRFPHGLRPISDAAHREGMGFVVWFEPERVHRGTYIAKEHPEWVITLDKGDSWLVDNGLFNLGLPAAREYMTRYLIAAIKAYGIDCLRIDYGVTPGSFWQFLDKTDPNRVGLAEIRYVEGFYQMWDDILRDLPHLFIDNCAGGGMRIDLETCSRSVPLWRTDATIGPLNGLDFNQAALQNQLMTAGLSRFVPFNTSGMMGATPYLFRSGFNAGISFCEDCRPPDYPRAQLKQGIAEGKRIRKYYFGEFYPLSEVTASGEDWCVLQYHRPEEEDGMIVAFRRHRSPYDSFICNLHEIASSAEYRVTTYPGYEPSWSITMEGAKLRQYKAVIEDCPGSLLVEYKKVHG
jgi:alpha-galactosidase